MGKRRRSELRLRLQKSRKKHRPVGCGPDIGKIFTFVLWCQLSVGDPI
jgi:hypothetical protein